MLATNSKTLRLERRMVLIAAPFLLVAEIVLATFLLFDGGTRHFEVLVALMAVFPCLFAWGLINYVLTYRKAMIQLRGLKLVIEQLQFEYQLISRRALENVTGHDYLLTEDTGQAVASLINRLSHELDPSLITTRTVDG